MRKALALLLLVASASIGGTFKDLEVKQGFRDVKLGCSVADLGATESTGKDGDIEVFRRPADQLSVETAKLDSILYTFYKGQLLSIAVRPADGTSADRLTEILTAAYGPPNGGDRWNAPTVELLHDPELGFVFISRPVLEQQRADEKAARDAAAKKAAGDI